MNDERKAEWVTTKYIKAGDEFALGQPRRRPAESDWRQVIEITSDRGGKDIVYHDDGSHRSFRCGSASKFWRRPGKATS